MQPMIMIIVSFGIILYLIQILIVVVDLSIGELEVVKTKRNFIIFLIPVGMYVALVMWIIKRIAENYKRLG